MTTEQQVDMTAVDAAIDAWQAATEGMTGKIVEERQPWVSSVTGDAIKHYAYGTDDDNPLWTDPARAAETGEGKVQAPPAFVIVNRYPILHGAPMKAPLASLIGGVEMEWFGRVYAGDTLNSEPRQKEFFEKRNKEGRRLNFIISGIDYRNQDNDLVARATGTMIMATQIGLQTMMEHQVPHYDDGALDQLESTWRSEHRRGSDTLFFEDVAEGCAIPSIVRGPLTIGDMVAWNAAIGPSYKAGRWGYLDLSKAMHTAMVNPVTGFPVKYSQQHEDANMAAGRGMPAPFDNGVMRFAWVAPLVTNWMGDDGFLKRLKVQVARPGLYGDLTTYSARVTGKDDETGTVSLEITGTRQDGMVNTRGDADVVLQKRP